MPCSDGGPCYSNDPSLERKLSELDALLCSACRVLARSNYDFDENPTLSEWWDEHKKEDAKRNKKGLKTRC